MLSRDEERPPTVRADLRILAGPRTGEVVTVELTVKGLLKILRQFEDIHPGALAAWFRKEEQEEKDAQP